MMNTRKVGVLELLLFHQIKFLIKVKNSVYILPSPERLVTRLRGLVPRARDVSDV